MKETSFWPTEEQMTRLAHAYRPNAEKKSFERVKIHFLTYPLENRMHRFPEGGGGLFSTPNDWVRIYRMLAGNGVFEGKRVLSEKSVETIRTKQTGDLPAGYGLGVAIYGDSYGHGGSHGTDSRLNVKNGRIGMYFIQEEGNPQAGSSRNAFFGTVMQE